MEDFYCVFNVFATVLSLVRIYYLISLTKSRGNEEELSMTQLLNSHYAIIMFICLIYVWYFLPWLFCNGLLMSTIYGSGFTNEDLYPPMFLMIAPYKESMKIVRQYALYRTLFLAFVGCYSNFVLDNSDMMLFCKVTASVLTIIMYSYRLIIIRLVIKTKRVQYIPFSLSFFMFVSAAAWLIFCLVEMDLFVAIPNGFITCLGVVQLILYARYRDSRQLQLAD